MCSRQHAQSKLLRYGQSVALQRPTLDHLEQEPVLDRELIEVVASRLGDELQEVLAVSVPELLCPAAQARRPVPALLVVDDGPPQWVLALRRRHVDRLPELESPGCCCRHELHQAARVAALL